MIELAVVSVIFAGFLIYLSVRVHDLEKECKYLHERITPFQGKFNKFKEEATKSITELEIGFRDNLDRSSREIENAFHEAIAKEAEELVNIIKEKHTSALAQISGNSARLEAMKIRFRSLETKELPKRVKSVGMLDKNGLYKVIDKGDEVFLREIQDGNLTTETIELSRYEFFKYMSQSKLIAVSDEKG